MAQRYRHRGDRPMVISTPNGQLAVAPGDIGESWGEKVPNPKNTEKRKYKPVDWLAANGFSKVASRR